MNENPAMTAITDTRELTLRSIVVGGLLTLSLIHI